MCGQRLARYVSSSRPTWGFSFDPNQVRHVHFTVHEVRKRGDKKVLATTRDAAQARLVASVLNGLPPRKVKGFLQAIGAPVASEAAQNARRHMPLGPMRQPGEHRFGD